MNRWRWLAVAVLAAAVAAGGWWGWQAWQRQRAGLAAPAQSVLIPQADRGNAAETIETVDAGSAPLPTGGTPMAERVAVVGLLNKRNGASRELTMRPGQALRVGDAVVRLRACERTAPWEQEPLTGAFVQLDVRGADRHWRRVFSGWLFKERPALNVVQHPVYDVWTKSCTMAWPETGADTTPAAAPGAARPRARKSPDASAPAAPAPTTPDSAADNNAT